MKDLSKIHNPYDFANPVQDKDLFVGREDEMEEIKYYLNHAKTAPRPINIAILGPRASGKTSLLNMCELEARAREFCTVRIDLDENDANTQLGFFYKIFDGLLASACEFEAFNGKGGKTYNTYLDIVNTYIIPEDKVSCPFLFPLQYARAMGSGNNNVPLSDNNYKSDLLTIHSELNRPILLLFDESNVLANSRVLLEKLRNIFMNMAGYMLVLTGTHDLFPVIDEVFSPIVRQFKKIIVHSYKDAEETRECIRKPLEKIGIRPEHIFDFQTYKDIREIHDLSGGRPYEIQLICHTLFRRIQDKRAKKMKLDLGVLEDVRKELETSQDITTRPILTTIKHLSKKQFLALNLLCACDGHASYDQIWTIEYIFSDEKSWTKEGLKNELQDLTEKNVIHVADNIIRFAGDDFDKIYTKYFAREQKIPLNFPELSLEVFWFLRLSSFLQESIKDLKPMPSFVASDIDIDIISIAMNIMEDNADQDVFVESPPIIKDLYTSMVTFRNEKNIPLIQIKITLPWLNVQSWYYGNPKDTKSIENGLSKIEPLATRIKEVGGNLLVEKRELPVIPLDILAKKIEDTSNEAFRNRLANEHAMRMFMAYTQQTNFDEASLHAHLSYRYNPIPKPGVSNNLGYFFMVVGEFDKAKKLFENAINSYQDSPESILPCYNLGMLEGKCGNLSKALEQVEICIKKIAPSDREEGKWSCLFVPRIIDGELKFEEIRQPDLFEVAHQAKDIFTSLLNKEI